MKILKIQQQNRTYKIKLDDQDYPWVKELHNEVKFHITKTGYVRRQTQIGSGKTRKIISHRLQRLLLNLPREDRRQVDHINRDKLDLQKQNLRIVYNAENSKNKPKITSKYTGLSYRKLRRKWSTRLSLEGTELFLGNFNTEEEGVDCYIRTCLAIWEPEDFECKSRITHNLKLLGKTIHDYE